MPTYTVDNKVQYIQVAQPAMLPPMVAPPVMYMPQMVPAAIPFQPAPLPPLTLNSLPLISTMSSGLSETSISPGTSPLFYDGSSFTSLPTGFTSLNNEGRMVAPPGYSFVTMNVPSASAERSASVCEEGLETSELDLLPIPSLTERTRSRSSSVVSVPEETVSTENPLPEETTAAPKPQNKKYRHRSKQTRILEVHAKLKEEYTAKGLYAGDDEVLRGFDTVRVHVKTYKALNRIECPLNDVEKHPKVQVLKIATPFSMKNRFQKKGFIVYLKLASPDMVPYVQEIFSHYKEDFAKCDVALKKEDKLAQDRAKAAAAKSESPFLSERAYSREGYDVSDWSTSGIAA